MSVLDIPTSESSLERNFALVRRAVDRYDPNSTEADHLRQHQRDAIDGFRQKLGEVTIDSLVDGAGVSIISPTGSGKTVIGAEVLRMFRGGMGDQDSETLNALMLVPRLSIREQTIGLDGMRGIGTFAPDLSVVEHKSRRAPQPTDVTVMMYQSLGRAMTAGTLETINPPLVVCDEAHHVIDGRWAKYVTELRPGRVLLGLTATPAYSDNRSIFSIFPEVAFERTMRDGIEAGYLCDLSGHVYKGISRISAKRKGGDFDEAEVFGALIDSEDNYLAAKIAAMEVAAGKRGVISCVPGFDRAHSKVIAKILSEMEITDLSGVRRKVRAMHVDGETKDLDKYTAMLESGEIDVFTNIDLLTEGWDSPAVSFAVLLRPTMSKVLAEQRLGRILRPLPGKIATVHELMYDFTDSYPGAQPQVTHLDLLDEKIVTQGVSYKSRTPTALQKAVNGKRRFDPAKFNIDADILARMSEFEAVPIDEIRVHCGQEIIPYDWLSQSRLSSRLKMDEDEIGQVLADAGVLGKHEMHDDQQVVYYPPRSLKVLIDKYRVPTLPNGSYGIERLRQLALKNPVYGEASRMKIRRILVDHDMTDRPYVDEGGDLVLAYPPEAALIFRPTEVNLPRIRKSFTPKVVELNGEKRRRMQAEREVRNQAIAAKRAEREARGAKPKFVETPQDERDRNEILDKGGLQMLVFWLNQTATHPNDMPQDPLSRRQIHTRQQALLDVLKRRSLLEVPEGFGSLIGRRKLALTDRARAVIESYEMDPAEFLFYALRAKRVSDVTLARRH